MTVKSPTESVASESAMGAMGMGTGAGEGDWVPASCVVDGEAEERSEERRRLGWGAPSSLGYLLMGIPMVICDCEEDGERLRKAKALSVCGSIAYGRRRRRGTKLNFDLARILKKTFAILSELNSRYFFAPFSVFSKLRHHTLDSVIARLESKNINRRK